MGNTRRAFAVRRLVMATTAALVFGAWGSPALAEEVGADVSGGAQNEATAEQVADSENVGGTNDTDCNTTAGTDAAQPTAPIGEGEGVDSEPPTAGCDTSGDDQKTDGETAADEIGQDLPGSEAELGENPKLQDVREPAVSSDLPTKTDEQPKEKTSNDTADTVQDAQVESASSKVVSHVAYQAHSQSVGWQKQVEDGAQAGVTGKSKRLEALKIKLLDPDGNEIKGVTYKVYVQNGGWQAWKSDFEEAGTTGQSQRIEAIRIKLSEELGSIYDILYRAHVQSFGWLDWTGNGNAAGSMGYAKRLEALQIKLRKKSSNAFGSGKEAVKAKTGVYLTGHVQSYGWLNALLGYTGTTGQRKRLEAVRAQIASLDDTNGAIEYVADVVGRGKGSTAKNGQIAGTTGQSKAAEGFLFRLTGDLKEKYDIYYCGHSQTFGWLNWAKNGESYIGTDGFGKRIEAIQVRLVPKGGKAPASLSNWSAPYVPAISVEYGSTADGKSWQGAVNNGANSGNTNGNLLDKFYVKLNIPAHSITGGISYSVHTVNGSWSASSSNGKAVGTAGKNIDAIRIHLTGEYAKVYDVYYSSHVPASGKGWLSWASNGANSGTQKTGTGIDAVRVKLVPKGSAAPAPDPSSYKFLVPYFEKQTARDETISRYITWAVDIAQDNSHGYSQYNRWGPNYDCSSFVVSALNAAGLRTGGATYTGNMINGLSPNGWSVTRFSSPSQLQRGDILLNVNNHTEMYIGAGYNVGALIAETGSVHGRSGDQTGNEITVKKYNNYRYGGWNYFLRLR